MKDGLSAAMPGTMRSLAGWLAGELLAAAVVIAFGSTTRARALLPMVTSGALALLVVEVMLRETSVGVLGSWLADANIDSLGVEATMWSTTSIVENMAPVLTMLFTPLFAVTLAGAAIVYAVTGLGGAFDRELLGVFDALMVVVLGLVSYGMSAPEPIAGAGVDRPHPPAHPP